MQFIPSREAVKYGKALKRIEKLKETAHADARALEAKHNRLIDKAIEAQKAVQAFERDELGVEDAEQEDAA